MRLIGGKYRGRKIKPVHQASTRPTSDRTREMIFNVLLHNPAFGPDCLLKKDVLDVYAGTGAFGLEAFSRGAQRVCFIENHRQALSILKETIKSFDLPSSCILNQDAQTPGLPPHSFDLVFLDPPYHKNLSEATLSSLYKKGWFAEEAVLIVEVEKNEAFHPPSFCHLVIERVCGAAKILFLKL